jgi:hypothetical protein
MSNSPYITQLQNVTLKAAEKNYRSYERKKHNEESSTNQCPF